jgi:mannosyltransferase
LKNVNDNPSPMGRQPGNEAGARNLAWPLAIPLLLVLIAFGLRALRLDAQSLWFDEGWSWHLARLPLGEMALTTAGDRSPALYYALLHGWIDLAGDSEFAMRFLSVFADVVTLAAVMALARALAGRRSRWAPLVAGLLYAVSPLGLWYAQETRMYALVGALCVTSTYWLWRWLRDPRRLRALVGSAVLLALAVHSHYYAIFLLPAHGAAVLGWLAMRRKEGREESKEDRSQKPEVRSPASALRTPHSGLTPHSSLLTPHFFLRWALAALAVVAALVPWLLVASAGFAYDDGFEFPLNTVAGRMGEWVLALASGGLARALPEWWPWALLLAAVAGTVGLISARRWRELGFIILLVVVPLLAATVAVRIMYPYRSVFHPRYLIYVAPLACVWFAGAWGVKRKDIASPSSISTGSIPVQAIRRPSSIIRLLSFVLGLSSFVALAALWLPGLAAYYTDPALARDDVRGAAAHVAEAWQPGDLVVMTRDNYALHYYARRYPDLPLVAVPQGLHGVLAGDAAMVDILNQYKPQRVRLFLWQDDVVDPQKLVESTLWAHGYEIGEINFGQIRLPLYQVQDQRWPAAGLSFTPVSARFGSSLGLTGYWMRPQSRPGDWFYVVLTWLARQKLEADYKVFVHVWGADGHVLFQRDKRSLNDLLPMSRWTPGRELRDDFAMVIPADLPPGEYRVVVGVYDPAAGGTRLAAQSDRSPVVSDAVVLGVLKVTK